MHVAGFLTIMTTCSRPFARARSPIFSQYLAESCSSPSIMVDPWEKKCTGAILPFLVFPTAILSYGFNFRYAKSSWSWPGGVLADGWDFDDWNWTIIPSQRQLIANNYKEMI